MFYTLIFRRGKMLLRYSQWFIAMAIMVLGLFIKVPAFADEYMDAVNKAELNAEATTRTWVADGLQTITGPGDGNTYINIGGQNRLVVRTYSKEKNTYYYAAGQDTTTYGSPTTDATWVTTGNSLRNYWAQNNINYSNVQPETARALGMNTNVTNDTIMEYIVVPNNENIQRPVKGPDITTYNKNTFPLPVDNFVRPSGISDQKYADYIAYYNNWKKNAYSTNYFPWTQYGYTYRWGYGDDLDDIDGLSEFIMLGKTPVRIYGIYSIQSYLYTTGNGSGDFNVTNNVNTLWAGRRFQPHGNTINITRNALVSGGQGILVSSPGYTINNDGQIIGPTLKKFNYNNTENIAVLFQGIMPTSPNVDPIPNNNNTLNNTGTITSPGIAVGAYAGNTIINNNNGSIEGEKIGIFAASGNSLINNNGGYIQGGQFAVLTGAGTDQINLTNGILQGKINLGAGLDTININPGAGRNLSEIIFNLSTTTAPIQNVETINVNDTLRLSPINNQFIPNNQIYPFAPNANVAIAAGKSIQITPVINMPMITFNMDATNTSLISYRDLSWYTKNTPNSSLGQSLDTIASLGGGLLADELYLLDSSTNPGANASQLEPVNQTGAYTSAFYSTLAFVDTFRERLKRLRVENNPQIPPNSNVTGFAGLSQVYFDQKKGRVETFANGYGYKQWFRNSGNTTGYETSSGGFISGAGGRFGKGSYAGLIFGISNYYTRYNTKTSSITDTTYRVGPYTSLHLGPVDFDALVTYGYHSLSSKRSINFLYSEAGSDYSMNELTGYFGLSKAFNLKRGFHIIPQANLQYMFLNRSGYSEIGAGDVNLTVNKNNYNSLLTRVGVTVMKDFKIKNVIIRPQITSEWLGECLNPAKNIVSSFTNISNSQFITTPGGIDYNSARIGAGLSIFSAKSNSPLSFFVQNDTILGKRGVINAISAGLRIAL